MYYESLHGTSQAAVYNPVAAISESKQSLRRKAYLSYAWRNKKPQLQAAAGAPRKMSWKDGQRVETCMNLPQLAMKDKKTYHRPWTAELPTAAMKDKEIARLRQKIAFMKTQPLKQNVWARPSRHIEEQRTKSMTQNNVLGTFRQQNHSPIRPYTGEWGYQLYKFSSLTN
jgi:hypothetical protein